MEKNTNTFRTNTFVQRPPFQIKYSIPERQVDTSVSDKLFLLFQEGNLSKIKDYIVSNNISHNIVNEDGQTIAHLIIKNTSLNDFTKRELIKFLNRNGGIQMTFDKFNTTPLHLACKYQLKDIVEILLKNGHSPNAEDSLYKTPLHYSVGSLSQECNKKEKSTIIPKDINKNKIVYTELLKELLVFVDSNSIIKKYITHIKNIFSNIDDILERELEDKIKDSDKELIQILQDQKLSDDGKNLKINDTMAKTKLSVVKFIESKLNDTLTQFQLTNGLAYGWGPDNLQRNRILPISSLEEFNMGISREYNNKLDNFKKNMSDTVNSYGRYVKNMSDSYANVSKLLNNIIYYNHGDPTRIHQLEIDNRYTDQRGNIMEVQMMENINSTIDIVTTIPTLDGIPQVPLNIPAQLGIRPPVLPAGVAPLPAIPGLQLPNGGITFNRKLKFLIYYFATKLDEIRAIENLIYRNLAIDRLDLIYEQNIPDLLTILCFTILNLKYVKEEYDYISGKLNLISESVSKLTRKHDIRENLEVVSNTFSEKMNIINNLYKICVQFQKDINDLIELINFKSSMTYIQKYNNNLGSDFDNVINNRVTDQLSNLFDTSIAKIILLPNNYDEYIKTTVDDTQPAGKIINKRTIFEMLQIQITTKNFQSYISPIPSQNPVIGYVNNRFVNIIQTFDKYPTLRFGKQNDGKTNLDDAQINHNGRVGKLLNANQQKRDRPLNIVSHNLDVHLKIIKYIIVRFVLQTVNDNFAIDDPLINEIRNIKKQFDKILYTTPEDKGMLYVIIGNSVDQIIISNIKNMISLAANKISYKETAKRIAKINSFNQITRLIPMQNTTDIDFDSMNDEIVEYFMKKYGDKLKNVSTHDAQIFEDETPEKQIKVNGIDMIDRGVDFCYKYDSSITNMLIKNGANVNVKDKDGNTPIFDAIAVANIEGIDILLQNGSVIYNPNYLNRFGVSGLKYSTNLLNEVISNITQTDFLGEITKNTNQEIIKKTQHKSLMRFNEIILKMAFYLLNHQLYLLSKGYPKSFTYKESQELMKLLNLREGDIPLLNIQEITESNSETQNIFIKRHSKIIDTNISQLENLHNQIKQIKEEKNDLITIRQLTMPQVKRLEYLNKKIYKLEDEISDLDSDIKKNMRLNQKTSQKLFDEQNKYFSDVGGEVKKSKYLQYSDDVTDIYSSIFDKIINGTKKSYSYDLDLLTYPNMWKKIQSDNKDDHTQIVQKLLHKTQEISQKENINGEELNDMSYHLNLFNSFSDNVLNQFINDYFDLPNVYSTENYGKTKIMNIIIHITKHVLCTNLYHIIIKLLKKTILDTIELETFANDESKTRRVEELLKNAILTSGSHVHSIYSSKSSLIEYIFSILPEKIVKSSLQIFEHDNDPDKDIDTTVYLEDISKRLMSNTVVALTEESSVIKSLNEYIFPYFREYMEINIRQMKQICDNYLRCLLSYNKYIKITSEICNKAVKELEIISHHY